MKQAAHYASTSTQSFTEILDIREDIILMTGGNACILIEIQAVNFELLSSEEQEAKVYAYAGLLNSLSFPVQISIISRKIDIVPYINSLGVAAAASTNQKLAQNILQYQQFVKQLVTTTSILNKQFFFVISYSLLEEGIGGATKLGSVSEKDIDNFFLKARAALHTKAESLLSQIDRINLKAKVVEKDQLVQLFQSLYNES